jgi:hypothetical protein
MKQLRVLIYLVALIVAGLFVALKGSAANPGPALLAAFLFVFVVGNVLAPQSGRLCVTYSTTVLLADVMEAFKVRFPMLFGDSGFGTDFSDAQARKDDQIIAKIRTLPSVQDYDATNGYKANAAEASSLLVDVPLTLNRLKHVPVKVDHLDQLASRIDLYKGAVADMAFVLGKSVVDYGLSLIVANNFSYGTNETIANTSKSTLNAATKKLNTNGCNPAGRFGIVNSAFYNALEEDVRVSSKDFSGQQRTDNAYGVLTNVAGFKRIFEYPDFPANAQNLNAFFGTRPAIAVAARLPKDSSEIAKAAGIPMIAKFDTLTDPDSGLSLFCIEWMEAGTFDLYTTVALLYGAAAGKQAGNAGTICDKAGYRVTESGGAY